MWRDELRNNCSSIQEISEKLRISSEKKTQLSKIVQRHPMSVTRHYLGLINKNDPHDPLKRIVIPSIDELDLAGSYDTSGEKNHTIFLGFQHKYAQTALVLVTNRCACYCRFCFRKRIVGLGKQEVLDNFSKAVEYIKKHPEINNVLLSGGDPLILETEMLSRMLRALAEIKHLDFVRIGSKMPVYLPQRFLLDPDLLKLLQEISSKYYQVYLVSHIDHYQEISAETVEAVKQLQKNGVIINNQTVLMRGVNDNPQVLAELQNRLVAIGINPYYVFQCRPVKRVKKRFQIPLVQSVKIVEEAKTLMNGHSKRFKFIMSHKTGKIEVLGVMGDEIYFKYHQAFDSNKIGKMFKRKITPDAGWLEEFKR